MDRGLRPYWAEFVGTFALCFVGQGAICTHQLMGAPESGLLGIAVAHGLALAVMITAFAAVSGGHLNPAVTLGFVVTGRQSAASGLRYGIAQLLGAVVASVLLRSIFPSSVVSATHLGAAAISSETSVASAFLIEFVLTFFLVTAFWGTAVDERAPRIGGFGIGLTVTMDILMGGPLTGAAMNPARAFGAAAISGFWDHHWLYWAAPLLGGAAAAAIYSKLCLEKS